LELELPLVEEQVYQLSLTNISGEEGTPITNPADCYPLNRFRK
jgi:hypothetical protein